ncbi:hypothetical protein E9993_01690 [Labilibacter sediminis]|nr:hypothetical protein E9993_01690 [Labilibacter sediminis]
MGIIRLYKTMGIFGRRKKGNNYLNPFSKKIDVEEDLIRDMCSKLINDLSKGYRITHTKDGLYVELGVCDSEIKNEAITFLIREIINTSVNEEVNSVILERFVDGSLGFPNFDFDNWKFSKIVNDNGLLITYGYLRWYFNYNAESLKDNLYDINNRIIKGESEIQALKIEKANVSDVFKIEIYEYKIDKLNKKFSMLKEKCINAKEKIKQYEELKKEIEQKQKEYANK